MSRLSRYEPSPVAIQASEAGALGYLRLKVEGEFAVVIEVVEDYVDERNPYSGVHGYTIHLGYPDLVRRHRRKVNKALRGIERARKK